jgi:hypothetical protein
MRQAGRIIVAVGTALGMPTALDDLPRLRKGDPNKVICAGLTKLHSALGNEWLAKRLAMGHSAHVSDLVNRMRKGPQGIRTLWKYEKLPWKNKV